MRRLAAIALAAVAACAPAAAAPAAPQSCAAAAHQDALACLLDRAEALLAAAPAKDAGTVGALWNRVAEAAADAGDLEWARRAAARITDPGQQRMMQARLGALLAERGDRQAATAALDGLLAAPAAGRQVDWPAALLLAALGDPARSRAYLQALAPDRQVNALLALVREEQRGGHMDRAETLLADFGGTGDNANVPIIIHSAAALAFVKAGRLDAARRVVRLLPESDRLRVEARIALKQDRLGRTAEARKAIDALVAGAPRSSDTRLVAALIAARHKDFAAAQATFPSALSYDADVVGELLGVLARAGETGRAAAMIATMNNGKDRASAFSRMAILLAKAGKPAEAAPFLAKARAILDPLVSLKFGAAPQLMDFGPALRDTVEAMLALGQAAEARAFVDRQEKAVQTDPYGLARPGVTTGLVMTNEALFVHQLKTDPAAVAAQATRAWRATAAINAFLAAGKLKEAILVAERENPSALAKTGDILIVAQYIAKH